MEKLISNIEQINALKAAEILGLNYQTLIGMYQHDHFKEFDVDEDLEDDVERLFDIILTQFDPGNEKALNLLQQAMQIDPHFKEFVEEILIDACADEIVSGCSMLSPNTFKIAMGLIDKDPILKERLENKLEELHIRDASYQFAKEHKPQIIKQRVFEILDRGIYEELLSENSPMNRIHRLVCRYFKDFNSEFTEQESRALEVHFSCSECVVCDLIKKRQIYDYKELLQFLADTREFIDLLDS